MSRPPQRRADVPAQRPCSPVPRSRSCRFLHVEAAGGILLVVATVVALVWANSPWQASYESLWSTTHSASTSARTVFDEDLAHVVNDLLMALFFFVVGMEIKRELVVGELRDRRAVALPAMAALGGMIVPAADLPRLQRRRRRRQRLGHPDGDRHRLRARASLPCSAAGSRRRSRCCCSRWRSSTTSARSS